MKAVVDCGRGKPCVVRWTGRQGLKAVSKMYCGAEANAGEGVLQVPEDVEVHEACKVAMTAFYPPKATT